MFRKGFTITRGSIITDTTLLISRNACQTPTPGEVVLVGLFFDLPVLSPSPSVAPDSAFAVISAVPSASCPLTLGGHRGRLMREHRGHAVIYAGHTGRTQGGHRGEG